MRDQVVIHQISTCTAALLGEPGPLWMIATLLASSTMLLPGP
jgi:hypothetical protein